MKEWMPKRFFHTSPYARSLIPGAAPIGLGAHNASVGHADPIPISVFWPRAWDLSFIKRCETRHGH